MRIIVIGAGIVGTRIATTLVRRGAEVTLIDRGRPGEGTTAGSFAWVDASHPGLAPYLELRVLGVRAWQRERQDLGCPDWLCLNGTMIWTGDADEAAALEAHSDRLERLGYPVERLTPPEAREYEPDLRLGPEIEAVYRFPGEGWVQTGPAVAALLEQGRAAGLRIRTHTEVQGLELAGRERLDCDAVVSCVGRWTGSLLAAAEIETPMLEPGRPEAQVAGLVAQTTPVDCHLASVLLADGVLIRPDGPDRLLLHSDKLDGRMADETPPPGLAEELLGLLRQHVGGTEAARVESARVCLRAIPADLLPIVGWAGEGLYVVASHSGVTLAPALGELVAAELLDGEQRHELARFRPGRFRSVPA